MASPTRVSESDGSLREGYCKRDLMRINKGNHKIWYRETTNKLKTPRIFESIPQHVDFIEFISKLLLHKALREIGGNIQLF